MSNRTHPIDIGKAADQLSAATRPNQPVFYNALLKAIVPNRTNPSRGKRVMAKPKRTLNEVIKLLAQKNIKLLFPADYKNVSSHVRLKCVVCKNTKQSDGKKEWAPTLTSVLNGNYGCPKCSVIRVGEKHVGKRKHSEALVLAEAIQHETRGAFKEASPTLYRSALKHYKEKAFAHMGENFHEKFNDYTLQDYIEIASKYSHLTAWRFSDDIDSYNASKRRGMHPEIKKHLKGFATKAGIRRDDGYWTSAKGQKEMKAAAKDCSNAQEFLDRYPDVINAARKYDKYEEITKHFVKCISYGEQKIWRFLTSHNIQFTHQKSFDGLRNKLPLRFDFHIESLNCLIEFDGEFHETDLDTQKNDALKNIYAEKNNIALLRIHYDHIKCVDQMLTDFIKSIKPGLKLAPRKLTKKELRQLGALGTRNIDEDLKNWEKCKGKTIEEVNVLYPGLISALKKRGLYDPSFLSLKVNHKKWSSVEKILQHIKDNNITTTADWGHDTSYYAACKKGWITKIEELANLTISKRKNGYWSKERIQEFFLNFKNVKEMFKHEDGKLCYQAAQKLGIIEECSKHFAPLWSKSPVHQSNHISYIVTQSIIHQSNLISN